MPPMSSGSATTRGSSRSSVAAPAAMLTLHLPTRRARSEGPTDPFRQRAGPGLPSPTILVSSRLAIRGPGNDNRPHCLCVAPIVLELQEAAVSMPSSRYSLVRTLPRLAAIGLAFLSLAAVVSAAEVEIRFV